MLNIKPVYLLLFVNVLSLAVLVLERAGMPSWINALVSVDELTKTFLVNISYAILSSTIFYVIVVWYPHARRKNHNYRYITNKISIINSRVTTLIVLIKENSDAPLDKGYSIPDSDTMDVLCRAIDASKMNSSVHLVAGNWFSYINSFSQSIRSDLTSLFQFSELLSDELLGVLSEIEDVANNHLSFSMPPPNKDICIVSHAVRELALLSDQSLTMFEREFKVYQKYHDRRYHKRRLA